MHWQISCLYYRVCTQAARDIVDAIHSLRTKKNNPSLLPTSMFKLEVSTDAHFLRDLLFMIRCCVVVSPSDVAMLFQWIFVNRDLTAAEVAPGNIRATL